MKYIWQNSQQNKNANIANFVALELNKVNVVSNHKM